MGEGVGQRCFGIKMGITCTRSKILHLRVLGCMERTSVRAMCVLIVCYFNSLLF